MSKNKITDSFRLFSVLSVLGAASLSRLLQIGYMWSSADVTISRGLVYIFLIGYELSELMAVSLALSVTVYAHSYFGKKTAVVSSFISLGCLATGKLITFIYQNFINYDFHRSRLIAAIITYEIDIAFYLVFIFFAFFISVLFAKKRQKKPEGSSPLKAAVTSALVFTGINHFLIPVIDLSVQNVIPFLTRYDDISGAEIRSIILDYLYTVRFLPLYIIAITALTFVCFKILVSVTGRLKLKTDLHS